MTVEVLHGNCLELMRVMPDASFDSCVTDPPYGLGKEPNVIEMLAAWMSGEVYENGGRGFMGKKWDSFIPGPHIWREVYRVLKPGAHLLVFAGTRTVDLMGLSVRLAGFEIRDSLHWCYGSGFPKSLNVSLALDKRDGVVAQREVVHSYTAGGNAGTSNSEAVELSVTRGATEKSRAWDGWGTALKPSHEPIIMARKPFATPLIDNVVEHGTGAMNVDACRIGTNWSERPASWHRSGNSAQPESEKIAAPPGEGIQCHPGGRWPANTLLTHNHDCRDGWCTEWCPVMVLGEQSGASESSDRPRHNSGTPSVAKGKERARVSMGAPPDSGTAARYFHQSRFTEDDLFPLFYCAKAGTAERDAGLEVFRSLTGAQVTNSKDGQARLQSPRAGAGRNGGRKNPHPTVKSIELMRYLVRLVTPPVGRVLDPFGGSGTTGVAAALEHFEAVLCELNDTEAEPYVRVARARIEHALKSTEARQQSLFGGAA